MTGLSKILEKFWNLRLSDQFRIFNHIGDLFMRKIANNFRRYIVTWQSPEVQIKLNISGHHFSRLPRSYLFISGARKYTRKIFVILVSYCWWSKTKKKLEGFKILEAKSRTSMSTSVGDWKSNLQVIIFYIAFDLVLRKLTK